MFQGGDKGGGYEDGPWVMREEEGSQFQGGRGGGGWPVSKWGVGEYWEAR